MNDNANQSMAKAMKAIPLVLLVVCLILGLISLFIQMEEATKTNILFFALFGIVGLGLTVLGFGLSALLEKKGENEKTSPFDDDVDIVA